MIPLSVVDAFTDVPFAGNPWAAGGDFAGIWE